MEYTFEDSERYRGSGTNLFSISTSCKNKANVKLGSAKGFSQEGGSISLRISWHQQSKSSRCPPQTCPEKESHDIESA
eukprot:UN19913